MFYAKDNTPEKIAKICHSVNTAYCKTIGEPELPNWENLSEEFKQSSISGVIFKLQNPNSTLENQHEEWMKTKIADGWIYGTEKDMDKKTHPCLVPYDQLPQKQKIKDYLFQAIVMSYGIEKAEVKWEDEIGEVYDYGASFTTNNGSCIIPICSIENIFVSGDKVKITVTKINE